MGGLSSAITYARDLLDALAGPAASGVVASMLAIVFAVSGYLKLRHPILAAMAIVEFGATRRVRPILGWSLGVSELTIAAALVAAPRFGGAIAAALLWSFVVLIARSLRTGGHFACFCFGDGQDSISRWTLARTTVLALLATGLAIFGRNVGTVSTDVLIQAEIAAALLGTAVLLRNVPRLLRWNADPFDEIRKEEARA